MTALLLLLLAGCGRPSPAPVPTGPVPDPSTMALVEVRVWGDRAQVAGAPGCAALGPGPGLNGVLVWSPALQADPRRERLSWTDCGADRQAMVLPLGSELRLENHREEALDLRWTQDGRGDQARLAPGGTRTLHLDDPTTLRLNAADGGEVVVVVGGVGAVTDPQGQASLSLAATGEHELWLYHPTVGMRRARVDLVRGERVHLEVELGLDRSARASAAMQLPPS